MRRTDNVDFMRTLRRARRGEPLNATQQDDVVITLPSGTILNGKSQLKAATLDFDQCTQLILSELSDASGSALLAANDEMVPDNDLAKLVAQTIASKTISPDWRMGTMLHGANVLNAHKLRIHIASDDVSDWLGLAWLG
ncbi:MAG: hypothetical protein ACI9HX_001184 [Pseudoalteromonas tetraodonis]|jgi:hypothetical protein